MSLKVFLTALLVLFGINAEGQTPIAYQGKLTELRPDVDYDFQRVFSTQSPVIVKYRFEPKLPANTVISSGKFTDGRVSTNVDALLVEPSDGLPTLAIDLNSDLTITTNERFPFVAVPGTASYLQLGLRLPISNRLFPLFPIYVQYFRNFRHPKLKPTDRLLNQSVWAYAMADLNIDGKVVKFRYPFDPSEPTISVTEGQFGLDVDGNGEIESRQFSIETSYASGAEIVFRYGEKYLSTAGIDLAKNEVVVRRREKSEYLREELAVGKPMTDFSFTDFMGKVRRLKEFRGKYLLIEWWGVWCADCVRDMPFTVAAYKRFNPHGFEILGLNWDDKVEEAKSFLQKADASWPQATKDSIKALTEVTYRIQSYPATILLDPEGRVLSLDQKSLQGPALGQTLDALISTTGR